MVTLKNLLVFAGFGGAIGAVMYPIYFYPMQNSRAYRARQKRNREGLNQEEIQPGNMRVWSDPFQPLKKD